MCGIFGLINYGTDSCDKASAFRKATNHLFKISEQRGKDASGICVLTEKKASVYKDAFKGSKLVRTAGYGDVVKDMSYTRNFRAMIGHTRMKTKGTQRLNINNHPIIANKVIGVHNGMINNDDRLFHEYSDSINRLGQVDSEIIFRLIDHHISIGKTIIEAVKLAHKEMTGSYACAFIHTDMPRYLTLFSNAVSFSNAVLYIYKNVRSMAFASSKYILNESLAHSKWLNPAHTTKSIDLMMGGVRIDLETGKILKFKLDDQYKLKHTGYQSPDCNLCDSGSEMISGICSNCIMGGY